MENEIKVQKSSNVATILWLIFFFPVGLYFLWKKTNWSKGVKWTITGIFAFMVLTSGIRNVANPKTTEISQSQTVNSSPTNPPQPSNTPTPAKPLTLEEKIKNVLPDSMSDISVMSDKAINFTTKAVIPGKIDIYIDANHTGTYWDLKRTKLETWDEATNIIQKVFPLDNTINGIIIINKIPVTTAYGKKENVMLTTISVSRDTYNKIDFKNFDSKNIPTIADQYVENHKITD